MTASLQVNNKDGKYYVYLSWKQGGKRRIKTVGTGLLAKGHNKRKAETMMQEILSEWQGKIIEDQPDMLFSDYMATWLSDIKNTVEKSTYSNYKSVVDGVIRPYFQTLGVVLSELTPRDIQDFYTKRMEVDGISPNTIWHYHSYINGALNHAVDMQMLKVNPASKVKLPKKVKHKATAHEASVIVQLLEAAKGTKLEAPLRIAAIYGARRGEILGVKWKDVDLDKKRLYVSSVIARADGEFYKETPKNETSVRWFLLSDDDVEFFSALKTKQQKNRLRYGEKYCLEDREFVCVNDLGERLKLDYLSRAVPRLAVKLGLDRVKLHELRHTNISLLIASGATIKEVQEWAGHSSASTTTNIYAHALGQYQKKLSDTIHDSLKEASIG